MDSTDLHKQASAVYDEASLLRFLTLFASDFRKSVIESVDRSALDPGPAPGGWENSTVDALLEAAVAWASDSAHTDIPVNPWRRCAEILLAGKYYE